MSPRLATLAESLLVLLIGIALGLGANAMRERGLDLGRDHFPKSVVAPAPPKSDLDIALPPAEAATEAQTSLETDLAEPTEEEPTVEPPRDDGIDPLVAQRLSAKGLRAIGLAELQDVLEHEYYGYGLYMLLDARRPGEINLGHLPGARAWDPYAPDLISPELLSEVQSAQRVVVYCNGGDCEDSETAALQLLGFGVPAQALQVYAGGYAEWTERGLPIEKGAP